MTVLKVFVLLSLCLSACSNYPRKELLYIGTGSGEGLFVFEFDRAGRTFHEIQRITDRTGGFQAIHPEGNFLYTVSGKMTPDSDHGSVTAYRIDHDTGMLSFVNTQSSEGEGPAHVSVDPQGRFVYVSNYSGGSLSSLPILSDGSLGKAISVMQHSGSSINEQRQRQPHVHSTIPAPDGRFVYASDLGTDKVMIYAVHQETGELSPAGTPYVEIEPGSGPRHFTFHTSGIFAYSVDELSSTVTVLAADDITGSLKQIQRVDMLPEEFEGISYSADIHISPDGKFLYATNRGHDSLAIYSIDSSTGHLALLGHEPTRGGHPRNFAIDKYGEYIFMTNRDEGNLVLFQRHSKTGLIEYAGLEVAIPRAICVTQHLLY